MTALLTATATAGKLAEMFTANTGRSILDSGDAYGRNYDRHAGKTVSDFLNASRVTIDRDGMPTLDAFHFMNDALDYSELLDSRYNRFDSARPTDSYTDTLNEWLESIGVDTTNTETYGGVWDYNSYNSEYDLLDQGYAATFFEFAGEAYTALQIHGGCDVRGGYTRPTIFQGGFEDLLNSTSTRLYCPDCEFTADYQDGEITDVDLPISYGTEAMLIPINVETKLPTEWNLAKGCPLCKKDLI
jgi:hypothetical protein